MSMGTKANLHIIFSGYYKNARWIPRPSMPSPSPTPEVARPPSLALRCPSHPSAHYRSDDSRLFSSRRTLSSSRKVNGVVIATLALTIGLLHMYDHLYRVKRGPERLFFLPQAKKEEYGCMGCK
jgi:hypothetical protein